uniref:EF-hand domain-containing protein n=1 Tax=Macrostomum lignano TaxID=282301 RepID=A0A1I8I7I7_9PLAT
MTEAAEAPEDFALVEESLELLKKCRSVFQLFNRGSDSMLTRDLGSALRALGQIPSDQEVEMIASKLEQDDIYDKAVWWTPPSSHRLLTGSGEALTQAEMKELLQEAGVNKDGKIDY